jgi:hypothetical protein
VKIVPFQCGVLILLAIMLATPINSGEAKQRHGVTTTAKERAAYRTL